MRKTPKKSAEAFPVVAVGASAGGLEAFKELLENLPERPGMAFVLIQHLDPTHESMLTEILTPSVGRRLGRPEAARTAGAGAGVRRDRPGNRCVPRPPPARARHPMLLLAVSEKPAEA